MTELESTGPTGSTEPTLSTESTGPTGSTEHTLSTESTGPTGGVFGLSSLTGGTAAPPRILLADLLADVSVIQQQEDTDRAKLLAISSPDLQDIRIKLTTWVAGGFQGFCPLVRFPMAAPNVCSDGVVRNVYEYIQFLSGKSLTELIVYIQTILSEFDVGYQWSRNELTIGVVSLKAG